MEKSNAKYDADLYKKYVDPYKKYVDPYMKEVSEYFNNVPKEERDKRVELFKHQIELSHDELKLPWEESDQKAKADAGKPHVSLVPSQIVYDIARIREYGNKKYPEGGKDNWKRVEVERYRDAAYRHLLAYIDDPHGVDEESGLPHLWHLACNIAFLCELENDNFGEKVTEEDISYMD